MLTATYVLMTLSIEQKKERHFISRLLQHVQSIARRPQEIDPVFIESQLKELSSFAESRHQRKVEACLMPAVRAADSFNAHGLNQEAAALVEKALAVEWDDRLVCAYRRAAAPEGSAALLAQIERCEQWARQHPNDAELMLTLGTLCLKQKLWGKAQRYLEDALSDAIHAATVREVHLKLAQLHESLNKPEQAAAHYRQCALATLI